VRRLRAAAVPYLLILPGGLWLTIFFAISVIVLISLSTQPGDIVNGFSQTFHFANYVAAWDNYHQQFIRSMFYAGIATVLCVLFGYPVAYWIAFRGGSRKSTYLFLLLPFFVSFVLRTVSWQYFLSDSGILLGPLKSAGILPQDFRVLATSTAVIGGLTYNYLPFMVLPVYVALERIDIRLVEAAQDLYATRATAFRRVVLPLSLPGLFAGVLLTFAISIDDFVVTSFVSGSTQTFPLWIWSATSNGLPPQVDVLGTLIFTCGLIVVVTSALLSRRGNR
jgi:spermidine/putrescine transport system permease protein